MTSSEASLAMTHSKAGTETTPCSLDAGMTRSKAAPATTSCPVDKEMTTLTPAKVTTWWTAEQVTTRSAAWPAGTL